MDILKKFADLGNFVGKVIQQRKPIHTKGKEPFLETELAIDESAIYKRMKLVPYTPDQLVSKRKIDIFNKMMLDEEISSSIEMLKVIRLSSGWTVNPASDDNIDKEVCEFIKWNLENVEGSFTDDLNEIMGALEMGISINELVLYEIPEGKYKGMIGLKAIKSKNPKYFNIYVDDFDNIMENGVVNISALDYGRQYPTDKFVIYSFNKRYENVFGTSRIRTLYDLWFFKQVVTKAWGIYLEKFGHPFTVISYPKTVDDVTKRYLMEVLRQIRLEMGILKPEDVKLDLIESSGGSSSMFLDTIRYINDQIRKTVLGQTLTRETTGVGSYSLGKVHFDILLFYEEQLGEDVATKAINNQIIKRLVDYNFDVSEYPKFEFNPLVQEDISAIIDKYYAGVREGIIKPIPEDEEKIREWLHLPKRKIEEETLVQLPASTQQKEVFTEKSEKIKKFQEKIFTGVVRRKFYKYEEKVDFAELKFTIENGVEKYTPRISEIIQNSVNTIISQIQKEKIIEEKKFDAINKIEFPDVNKVAEVFKNMFNDVLEEAIKQARREITKRFNEKVVRFQYDIDIRRLNLEEARRFFEQKAFHMADIEANYITEKVKTILMNSIKTGATIRDTIEAIQRELEPYYKRGLVEEEALRGYRLETVIRTNINEAMNEGRKLFFESPELEGYVVAYQYSAILDDRVRPNHACMDGRIYPITSPIWDIYTPPNGFNCFDELTEVYTSEGWKLFKELKGNEDFLTINPKTKTIEWQKAIRWYEDKYEGEMYHFNAWNFDLKCTPNHNLLVQKSWDRHQKRNNLKLINANQIADSDLFYRTSKWIGKNKEKYLGLMSAKTFARFIGYWLSEGNISKSNNNWIIKISQQQDKKYEIVEKLSEIKELLWVGKDAIYVKPLPVLVEYLQQFGRSFEKYVPAEIKEMTKDNIREFLDAYLLDDGYVSNDIKSYFTSSKKMADDLGELILKVGHCPSFSFEKRKSKEVKFKNGVYKLNTDIYYVRELESEYFIFHKKHLSVEQYKGFIYCVEVPKYHTIWVRRNGKTVWAGNCRCVLVPITQDEEWEESPPPPATCRPDIGFEKPGSVRRR
jgi:SPP1 gp7 family putative phage head morphogenesis protein